MTAGMTTGKTPNDGGWSEQPARMLSGLTELSSIVLSDAARQFIAIYQDLIDKADGALPVRASFDPTVLRKDLANAILYDVSDPEHVVFRIVGERMKSHFKINPVGRCYLEFVREERRSHALSAFRHCAELPCAMLSRTHQLFESGFTRYCEGIGVPLLGPDPKAPATHLLFMDSPVKFGDGHHRDDSQFKLANMLERYFVDLGNGVPEHFVDLVLPDIPNPFEDWR